MIIQKQQLNSLDIADWSELSDEDFSSRVESANLTNYSSWLLPQLVAHFGNWQRAATGLETVVNNCQTKHQRSLYRLTRVRRSLLIKNQTKQPEYGQLTPLILLGFRRNQNFSYESWRNYSDLAWLVEPDLLEAMLSPQPNITVARILEIREQGLTYRSGTYVGRQRNPFSTWQLYGIQDTEFGDLPKLQQAQLAQIWLAHPKHRRETMVLTSANWDEMPPPIISDELFEPLNTTNTNTNTSQNQQLPWNQ